MTKLPQHLLAQGFTLLEVLIAIVVLSIGLMGLAGIQAVGVRNTHSANLRTLAVQQAYDMADRMRANVDGVKNGLYDTITAAIPADPGCITTGCSTTQLRDYDQRMWNLNNQAMLPSGSGLVTATPATAAPNKAYVITVMWDDYRTGVTGVGCSGNPSIDLTCFQVTLRP